MNTVSSVHTVRYSLEHLLNAKGVLDSAIIHAKQLPHKTLILYPANDQWVGPAMKASSQPWDVHILDKMLPFVKPGSTVVDAGANFGSYTVIFAELAGKVVAFEPQKLIYKLLVTNTMINSLTNVEPINKALSFKNGIAHMNARVPDGATAGQVLAEVQKGQAPVNYGGMPLGEGGEAVEMITLDSLQLQDVSFIKIDVQGAERLMLYGAQETIRRCMPVINYEDTATMFTITQEMIRDMQIPQEVLQFDVRTFLLLLKYTHYKYSSESFFLPPGVSAPPEFVHA